MIFFSKIDTASLEQQMTYNNRDLGNHERSIVELSIANATEIHSFRLDSCESVVTRFGSPCARSVETRLGEEFIFR